MWEAKLWLSVAEYNRTGMFTRPKAIEPFQIDFIANQECKPQRKIRLQQLATEFALEGFAT